MKTTNNKLSNNNKSKELNIPTDILNSKQNLIHQNSLQYLDYEFYKDDFPAPAVFNCY